MFSGTARLTRSFVLRWVGLLLLVLVLAVRVLVSPVTCNNNSFLPYYSVLALTDVDRLVALGNGQQRTAQTMFHLLLAWLSSGCYSLQLG